MCVYICSRARAHVCVCDDFLKGNIYDSFMYKSFIRKILVASLLFS